MKTLINSYARRLAYVCLFGALATSTFSNSLFEISSSVLIGLWLLDAAVNRRARSFQGAWPLLLALWVGVNVLSITQSQYLYESVKGAFRIFRWMLLTLAVTDIVDDEEKILKAWDAVLAVVVFIAVDALVQGATRIEILRGRGMTAFYGPTGRITGPFPHANDFSAYLCLAVFAYAAAIAAAAAGKKKARLFFMLAGMGLAVACLILTYSRAAWIAVAAGLLLWAVLKRSIWPAVLVAVFVGAAYLQSPFLFMERIGMLARFWDGTVSERRLLWKESGEMIRSRPVLGYGVNTYSRNVEKFKDKTVVSDLQYAHNGYLQIAAETGLAGLAAFLAVIGFFLVRTPRVFFARSPSAEKLPLFLCAQGLYLGVAVFLLQAATDTTLQSLLLNGMLWMWIGMGWSAHRLMVSRGR